MHTALIHITLTPVSVCKTVPAVGGLDAEESYNTCAGTHLPLVVVFTFPCCPAALLLCRTPCSAALAESVSQLQGLVGEAEARAEHSVSQQTDLMGGWASAVRCCVAARCCVAMPCRATLSRLAVLPWRVCHCHIGRAPGGGLGWSWGGEGRGVVLP